jgi:hypothetical protein
MCGCLQVAKKQNMKIINAEVAFIDLKPVQAFILVGWLVQVSKICSVLQLRICAGYLKIKLYNISQGCWFKNA